MWIKAAACAVFAALVASPALAQGAPPLADRPYGPAWGGAVLPPYEITTIVRSTGLVPTATPVRAGEAYMVRAVDRYGRPMRVAVDARYGDILSVRPIAATPPWRDGPYESTGPTPRGPYYDDQPPRRAAPGATGSANPSPTVRPSSPSDRAAAVTPARPPAPRPKPAVKPVAAKPVAAPPTEVKPAEATPAATPAAGAEPESTPPKPAAPVLPPVAPLE